MHDRPLMVGLFFALFYFLVKSYIRTFTESELILFFENNGLIGHEFFKKSTFIPALE